MAAESGLKTLVAGLKFPEAPRWHDGRLWFSDFYAHRVLAVGLDGKSETISEVPGQPSGLGWTPEGHLLIVSMLDRKVVELTGRGLRVVADLSHLATGPCNDMVVDSSGRAYVGNFGFDRERGEPSRTTCLARIDPDGTVSVAADDLLFPNGAVITPDGKTLIVGETFAHRLTAFDVKKDGSLTKRRVFADLPGVFPDGCCLDADGAIWLADPGGHRVIRVFEGGRIDREISTGEQNAFACMLGGERRTTLFVCTSSASGSGVAQKTDGRIEYVEVDVPGAGLP
jgi:sugar lactone lactonase YvrE